MCPIELNCNQTPGTLGPQKTWAGLPVSPQKQASPAGPQGARSEKPGQKGLPELEGQAQPQDWAITVELLLLWATVSS